MIKKLLSINLIFSTIASSSVTIYAWAPTDFDNPKCIDIRKLGKVRIIYQFKKKSVSVKNAALTRSHTVH